MIIDADPKGDTFLSVQLLFPTDGTPPDQILISINSRSMNSQFIMSIDAAISLVAAIKTVATEAQASCNQAS